MLTLLLASDSSTSTRFLFPRVVRTLRLEEARDTVTRDEGLGDSFSLTETGTAVKPPVPNHTAHYTQSQPHLSSSPSSSFL